MKVEMSTNFKNNLTFTLIEDHKLSLDDEKDNPKTLPKGTQVLQIRMPKEISGALNNRLINATPQLLIIEDPSADITLTDLKPFLIKEKEERCPHGFGIMNDDAFYHLKLRLLAGHDAEHRKVCSACKQSCIVRDVFDPEKIRAEIEQQYGLVWDTDEVQEDFAVRSFLSPRAHVTRRSDGIKGTLKFTHKPRFYYNFQEET